MPAIFCAPAAAVSATAPLTATEMRRATSLWSRLRRLARRHRADVSVSLALQGGGAHGAFTWGILDRLLEEDRLGFDGISGASAGAVNAAVLASGWINGGRSGAKDALQRFWTAVADYGERTQALLGPLWPAAGTPPQYALLRSLTRIASPYQFNPSGFNPLERLFEAHIDFEGLRHGDAHRLFIAVTNVHSGKLRVLRNAELSAKALTASTCLPLLFQAVELEGQYYWDGGYSGNPALLPLLMEADAHDVLMIRLCSRWQSEVPTRPAAIIERTSEIGFNAGFLRELQIIAELKASIPAIGPVSGLQRRLRRANLHEIDGHDVLDPLGAASRVNTSHAFLTHLMTLGRTHAERWLTAHGSSLGKRSTLELAE